MTSVRVIKDASVGWVILDRPESMNALTVETGRELEEALRSLGRDASINVIAIRGAGGNFCAGGDFREVERLREGGAEGLRPLFEAFAAACGAVAQVEMPVVAVVEGVAAAGGFELMQAVDLVVVSDNARLSDSHIRFGQVPGGGSTQRLPRLLGRQQAFGLLVSGDVLSGAEAVTLGLAYRSFPAPTFEEEATAFLRTLASRHRDALVRIKRLVYAGQRTDLENGLDLELSTVLEHIAGEAGGTGVEAFKTRR
ncbi:enoyl-CoA hydratase/isomerase family protein [Streptomyces sp. NPDC046909]|uniref:enoyl-CoA hydratase/isomerase family protein n=1 Tax=Streptomyces sp. NPDC046909 TaxID=3155617 RepID=UPI0033FA1684